MSKDKEWLLALCSQNGGCGSAFDETVRLHEHTYDWAGARRCIEQAIRTTEERNGKNSNKSYDVPIPPGNAWGDAVTKSMRYGLSMDPTFRYYNLIIDKTGVKAELGYKGWRHLVMWKGGVKSIEAHIIYANDLYEISFTPTLTIKHGAPNFANPGEMLCAYAVAVLPNGEPKYKMMRASELNEKRDKALAGASEDKKKFLPWYSHAEQMCKVSVLRALLPEILPLVNLGDLAKDLSEETTYENVGTPFPEPVAAPAQAKAVTTLPPDKEVAVKLYHERIHGTKVEKEVTTKLKAKGFDYAKFIDACAGTPVSDNKEEDAATILDKLTGGYGI